MTTPGKAALRARLFWAARWLLGGPEYHAGPLVVCITDADRATKLIVRPRSDDVWIDPDEVTVATPLDVTVKLLATFLSEETVTLMRIIAHKEPVASKAVVMASKLERSKCYTLLAELRDRGLIRENGDGLVIVDKELWAAIDSGPAVRKCAA